MIQNELLFPFCNIRNKLNSELSSFSLVLAWFILVVRVVEFTSVD